MSTPNCLPLHLAITRSHAKPRMRWWRNRLWIANMLNAVKSVSLSWEGNKDVGNLLYDVYTAGKQKISEQVPWNIHLTSCQFCCPWFENGQGNFGLRGCVYVHTWKVTCKCWNTETDYIISSKCRLWFIRRDPVLATIRGNVQCSFNS